MREWIHIRTNSAKKYCFVSKLMGFLSSSVCGSKTSSGRKDGDVEGSSSAQGWGRAGKFLSLAVLAQSVCVTAGCSDKSSLSWSKDAFYQLLLALVLLVSAVPLPFSSAVLLCDLPKGTDSYSLLPAFPLPLALSPIIMRPLFHLANLKEILGRGGGGQLSAGSTNSLHKLRLWLMSDCVFLPCSVFGLPRFLTCLCPAAGRAVLCNGTGRVTWAETQGRAHKYWHRLTLCALLQKKDKRISKSTSALFKTWRTCC